MTVNNSEESETLVRGQGHPINDGPWRDIPGGARRAVVSKATITRAIRNGELKAYKVGRLTRLHIDDVDAWMRRVETAVRRA